MGHRDGAGCSRVEGPVMGLGRRASIDQHFQVGNPKGGGLTCVASPNRLQVEGGD